MLLWGGSEHWLCHQTEIYLTRALVSAFVKIWVMTVAIMIAIWIAFVWLCNVSTWQGWFPLPVLFLVCFWVDVCATRTTPMGDLQGEVKKEQLSCCSSWLLICWLTWLVKVGTRPSTALSSPGSFFGFSVSWVRCICLAPGRRALTSAECAHYQDQNEKSDISFGVFSWVPAELSSPHFVTDSSKDFTSDVKTLSAPNIMKDLISVAHFFLYL